MSCYRFTKQLIRIFTQQLTRLPQCIEKNRLKLVNKSDAKSDKAARDTSLATGLTFEKEVLVYSPYNQDIAPSDYLLSWSPQNSFNDVSLLSMERCKNQKSSIVRTTRKNRKIMDKMKHNKFSTIILKYKQNLF